MSKEAIWLSSAIWPGCNVEEDIVLLTMSSWTASMMACSSASGRIFVADLSRSPAHLYDNNNLNSTNHVPIGSVKLILIPTIQGVAPQVCAIEFAPCPLPSIFKSSSISLFSLYSDGVLRCWSLDDGKCVFSRYLHRNLPSPVSRMNMIFAMSNLCDSNPVLMALWQPRSHPYIYIADAWSDDIPAVLTLPLHPTIESFGKINASLLPWGLRSAVNSTGAIADSSLTNSMLFSTNVNGDEGFVAVSTEKVPLPTIDARSVQADGTLRILALTTSGRILFYDLWSWLCPPVILQKEVSVVSSTLNSGGNTILSSSTNFSGSKDNMEHSFPSSLHTSPLHQQNNQQATDHVSPKHSSPFPSINVVPPQGSFSIQKDIPLNAEAIEEDNIRLHFLNSNTTTNQSNFPSTINNSNNTNNDFSQNDMSKTYAPFEVPPLYITTFPTCSQQPNVTISSSGHKVLSKPHNSKAPKFCLLHRNWAVVASPLCVVFYAISSTSASDPSNPTSSLVWKRTITLSEFATCSTPPQGVNIPKSDLFQKLTPTSISGFSVMPGALARTEGGLFLDAILIETNVSIQYVVTLPANADAKRPSLAGAILGRIMSNQSGGFLYSNPSAWHRCCDQSVAQHHSDSLISSKRYSKSFMNGHKKIENVSDSKKNYNMSSSSSIDCYQIQDDDLEIIAGSKSLWKPSNSWSSTSFAIGDDEMTKYNFMEKKSDKIVQAKVSENSLKCCNIIRRLGLSSWILTGTLIWKSTRDSINGMTLESIPIVHFAKSMSHIPSHQSFVDSILIGASLFDDMAREHALQHIRNCDADSMMHIDAAMKLSGGVAIIPPLKELFKWSYFSNENLNTVLDDHPHLDALSKNNKRSESSESSNNNFLTSNRYVSTRDKEVFVSHVEEINQRLWWISSFALNNKNVILNEKRRNMLDSPHILFMNLTPMEVDKKNQYGLFASSNKTSGFSLSTPMSEVLKELGQSSHTFLSSLSKSIVLNLRLGVISVNVPSSSFYKANFLLKEKWTSARFRNLKTLHGPCSIASAADLITPFLSRLSSSSLINYSKNTSSLNAAAVFATSSVYSVSQLLEVASIITVHRSNHSQLKSNRQLLSQVSSICSIGPTILSCTADGNLSLWTMTSAPSHSLRLRGFIDLNGAFSNARQVSFRSLKCVTCPACGMGRLIEHPALSGVSNNATIHRHRHQHHHHHHHHHQMQSTPQKQSRNLSCNICSFTTVSSSARDLTSLTKISSVTSSFLPENCVERIMKVHIALETVSVPSPTINNHAEQQVTGDTSLLVPQTTLELKVDAHLAAVGCKSGKLALIRIDVTPQSLQQQAIMYHHQQYNQNPIPVMCGKLSGHNLNCTSTAANTNQSSWNVANSLKATRGIGFTLAYTPLHGSCSNFSYVDLPFNSALLSSSVNRDFSTSHSREIDQTGLNNDQFFDFFDEKGPQVNENDSIVISEVDQDEKKKLTYSTKIIATDDTVESMSTYPLLIYNNYLHQQSNISSNIQTTNIQNLGTPPPKQLNSFQFQQNNNNTSNTTSLTSMHSDYILYSTDLDAQQGWTSDWVAPPCVVNHSSLGFEDMNVGDLNYVQDSFSSWDFKDEVLSCYDLNAYSYSYQNDQNNGDEGYSNGWFDEDNMIEFNKKSIPGYISLHDESQHHRHQSDNNYLDEGDLHHHQFSKYNLNNDDKPPFFNKNETESTLTPHSSASDNNDGDSEFSSESDDKVNEDNSEDNFFSGRKSRMNQQTTTTEKTLDHFLDDQVTSSHVDSFMASRAIVNSPEALHAVIQSILPLGSILMNETGDSNTCSRVSGTSKASPRSVTNIIDRVQKIAYSKTTHLLRVVTLTRTLIFDMSSGSSASLEAILPTCSDFVFGTNCLSTCSAHASLTVPSNSLGKGVTAASSSSNAPSTFSSDNILRDTRESSVLLTAAALTTSTSILHSISGNELNISSTSATIPPANPFSSKFSASGGESTSSGNLYQKGELAAALLAASAAAPKAHALNSFSVSAANAALAASAAASNFQSDLLSSPAVCVLSPGNLSGKANSTRQNSNQTNSFSFIRDGWSPAPIFWSSDNKATPDYLLRTSAILRHGVEWSTARHLMPGGASSGGGMSSNVLPFFLSDLGDSGIGSYDICLNSALSVESSPFSNSVDYPFTGGYSTNGFMQSSCVGNDYLPRIPLFTPSLQHLHACSSASNIFSSALDAFNPSCFTSRPSRALLPMVCMPLTAFTGLRSRVSSQLDSVANSANGRGIDSDSLMQLADSDLKRFAVGLSALSLLMPWEQMLHPPVIPLTSVGETGQGKRPMHDHAVVGKNFKTTKDQINGDDPFLSESSHIVLQSNILKELHQKLPFLTPPSLPIAPLCLSPSTVSHGPSLGIALGITVPPEVRKDAICLVSRMRAVFAAKHQEFEKRSGLLCEIESARLAKIRINLRSQARRKERLHQAKLQKRRRKRQQEGLDKESLSEEERWLSWESDVDPDSISDLEPVVENCMVVTVKPKVKSSQDDIFGALSSTGELGGIIGKTRLILPDLSDYVLAKGNIQRTRAVLARSNILKQKNATRLIVSPPYTTLSRLSADFITPNKYFASNPYGHFVISSANQASSDTSNRLLSSLTLWTLPSTSAFESCHCGASLFDSKEFYLDLFNVKSKDRYTSNQNINPANLLKRFSPQGCCLCSFLKFPLSLPLSSDRTLGALAALELCMSTIWTWNPFSQLVRDGGVIPSRSLKETLVANLISHAMPLPASINSSSCCNINKSVKNKSLPHKANDNFFLPLDLRGSCGGISIFSILKLTLSAKASEVRRIGKFILRTAIRSLPEEGARELVIVCSNILKRCPPARDVEWSFVDIFPNAPNTTTASQSKDALVALKSIWDVPPTALNPFTPIPSCVSAADKLLVVPQFIPTIKSELNSAATLTTPSSRVITRHPQFLSIPGVTSTSRCASDDLIPSPIPLPSPLPPGVSLHPSGPIIDSSSSLISMNERTLSDDISRHGYRVDVRHSSGREEESGETFRSGDSTGPAKLKKSVKLIHMLRNLQKVVRGSNDYDDDGGDEPQNKNDDSSFVATVVNPNDDNLESTENNEIKEHNGSVTSSILNSAPVDTNVISSILPPKLTTNNSSHFHKRRPSSLISPPHFGLLSLGVNSDSNLATDSSESHSNIETDNPNHPAVPTIYSESMKKLIEEHLPKISSASIEIPGHRGLSSLLLASWVRHLTDNGALAAPSSHLCEDLAVLSLGLLLNDRATLISNSVRGMPSGFTTTNTIIAPDSAVIGRKSYTDSTDESFTSGNRSVSGRRARVLSSSPFRHFNSDNLFEEAYDVSTSCSTQRRNHHQSALSSPLMVSLSRCLLWYIFECNDDFLHCLSSSSNESIQQQHQQFITLPRQSPVLIHPLRLSSIESYAACRDNFVTSYQPCPDNVCSAPKKALDLANPRKVTLFISQQQARRLPLFSVPLSDPVSIFPVVSSNSKTSQSSGSFSQAISSLFSGKRHHAAHNSSYAATPQNFFSVPRSSVFVMAAELFSKGISSLFHYAIFGSSEGSRMITLLNLLSPKIESFAYGNALERSSHLVKSMSLSLMSMNMQLMELNSCSPSLSTIDSGSGKNMNATSTSASNSTTLESTLTKCDHPGGLGLSLCITSPNLKILDTGISGIDSHLDGSTSVSQSTSNHHNNSACTGLTLSTHLDYMGPLSLSPSSYMSKNYSMISVVVTKLISIYNYNVNNKGNPSTKREMINTDNKSSFSRSNALMMQPHILSILIQMAKLDTPLLISTIGHTARRLALEPSQLSGDQYHSNQQQYFGVSKSSQLSPSKDGSSITTTTSGGGALLIFIFIIMRCAVCLVPYLPLVVECILRCLEPSDPAMRRALLGDATTVLFELVRVYPMISFNQGGQKIAVGCLNGAIIVYDLRTATKWKILEPSPCEIQYHSSNQSSSCHPSFYTSQLIIPSVTAVEFSPDGATLASYSSADGCVKFWSLGSGGFLSNILAGFSTKSCQTFKLPPIIKNYEKKASSTPSTSNNKIKAFSIGSELKVVKLLWRADGSAVQVIREDGSSLPVRH